MRAKITVQMDNEAFSADAGFELARILRDLAKHVESGDQDRRLMDSNGNHVGFYNVEEESGQSGSVTIAAVLACCLVAEIVLFSVAVAAWVLR